MRTHFRKSTRTPEENKAIGTKSQGVGSTFEAITTLHHEIAKQRGILGHVEKNEPHAKMIRGRWVFTAAGVADYTGIFSHNSCRGKYLAAECKSIGGTNFPKSLIKPMQIRHLTDVEVAGGLALLLVEFRTDSEHVRCAIPWGKVPWKTKRTAESIDAEDCGSWLFDTNCYLSRFL